MKLTKLLSIVLTLALLITLVPVYGSNNQAEAAGSYFLFPNEKDLKSSARIVSNKFVTLTGTINGVVGSSISYKIEQVTASSDEALNSTQDISTGITTSGNNEITINNVELFAGLNKITFKGVAGTSTVEEFIYIEYRDSPMLTDLEILFEHQSYSVAESGVTMLYSNATPVSSTGNITIVGKAPNATSVTVEVNGSSYDFSVGTSTSNYRFSTSQLSIKKGMNTIKFKVNNSGQVVETTRLVNLYNGEVTHYDEKLTETISATETKVHDIVYGGEYSVSNGNITLSGKAIIPLPLYDITLSTATGDEIDVTDRLALETALRNTMSISITGHTSNQLTIDRIEPTVLDSDSKYIIVEYSYALPVLSRDTAITYTFKSPNNKDYNVSDAYKITLRDGTKAYIADINYLSGFDSSMTTSVDGTSTKANNENQLKSLQGTDIPSAGVDVYSIPMGIEVLVANYSTLGAESIARNIKSSFNNKEYAPKVIINSSGSPLSEVITVTVGNTEVSYLRLFFEFEKLDKSGVNNGQFWIDHTSAVNEKKAAIFKLQYGPYVKYESVVDGMSVQYDSYKDTNKNLVERLGGFAGRIMNIANNTDIRYKDSSTGKKSAFLFLNNVAVDIESYDQTNSPNSPLFSPSGVTINAKGEVTGIPESVANELAAIMNKAGENTLKFIFRTSTYSYESTIKFTIVPTNLPVIPAKDTDGVYPYTGESWPPVGNDPKFTYNAGVYTTNEAEFNVYGTFDFIDLGETNSDISSIMSKIDPKDYIVKISNPNWNSDVKWSLNDEFEITDRTRTLNNDIYNDGKKVSTNDANIKFYYDKDDESFFFNITGQMMPEDGSPLVYVISVFNAGEAGPRATYRLEVNPISIPFSVKSPVVEERITNQNYVEFIISSPGADSVTVGKEKAEKVVFLDYKDGITRVNAFRVVVKDLKANKETKISFTITRGENKITDSIMVKYVPTTIPGAEYLETMKSSHKVFNNSLTLTFPKNTNLIRSEFNQTENYATQVFNNHDILFAIANQSDGIVDRHMFEGQVPDYTATSQSIGNLYVNYGFEDLASRYITASPLFWIDAGLADDPITSDYDSISTGLDPFPFPNIEGKYNENFFSRYRQYDRELIPSNVGSLTLAYDSSIVANAGTTITVFRFDPVELTWENIGGVVDTKKGTITVPFTKFGYYVVAKLTRSYNDIVDHSYAREAMEAIYAKGVMNAIESVSQFGGDRYVTRGEFTRMIVKALELPLNYDGTLHFTYYPETITNANYTDSIYDYRYIETAARAGIVNGTRPGFFDEDVQLSRQDAAVILARALELKLETNSTKAKQQLDKVFKDGASFDYYAIPAVLAIQKKGFIVGKPINSADPKAGSIFDPKARMLRSDAAIIMARVMNSLKKLPQIYS